MIARLLICPDIEKTRKEINQTLAFHLSYGNVNHPDILYIKTGEKLGIAEARKMKEHFALKPYSLKGRAVVLEDVSVMTIEAQNALLKTIEELPQEAILLLGTSLDANLLPTVLSRCEITILDNNQLVYEDKTLKDIEKLLTASLEEKFAYIEKLKDKEGFLHALAYFFRQKLPKAEAVKFLSELLQAEQWAKQNVNIRAILEYLMLVLPKIRG